MPPRARPPRSRSAVERRGQLEGPDPMQREARTGGGALGPSVWGFFFLYYFLVILILFCWLIYLLFSIFILFCWYIYLAFSSYFVGLYIFHLLFISLSFHLIIYLIFILFCYLFRLILCYYLISFIFIIVFVLFLFSFIYYFYSPFRCRLCLENQSFFQKCVLISESTACLLSRTKGLNNFSGRSGW